MKKTFLTVLLAGIIAFSYTLIADASVSISLDVDDNHNGRIEKPKEGNFFTNLFHRKKKKPEIRNDRKNDEFGMKNDNYGMQKDFPPGR